MDERFDTRDSKSGSRAYSIVVALLFASGIQAGMTVGAGAEVKGNAPATAGKTFVFHNSIRDLKEFRAYAQIAARLKRYGKVRVDLGVLADRDPAHTTGVRSPWHEYGSYMAAEWAFFPPPKLAPYLPKEWVARNRELLLAKVAILKELSLDATFSSTNTQMLPEAFFRQYPQLRGPRVDNPLRSNLEAYSWCVDRPETLEMIEQMTADLKRAAPMVRSIESWVNDSGSGICWLDALYPGANGPDFCRGRDSGERVRGLLEAMDRGARKGGGPIQIFETGNFDAVDVTRIQRVLPAYAKLWPVEFTRPERIVVKSMITEAYPVRGIIDVYAQLKSLERITDPTVHEVNVDTCQSWYFRADDQIAVVERLVDLIEDSLRSPAQGFFARAQKAHALAVRWGGEQNSDRVMEAFDLVEQSFGIFSGWHSDIVLNPGSAYTATNRLLTRPLLVKPELLTPEEEAYFLPYIFSTDEQDARLDYNTFHGVKRVGPGEYHSYMYETVHDSAVSAAERFEDAAQRGAPEAAWFRQLARSLRLWASVVRSHNNFYFGQVIRDRYKAELAGPPRVRMTRREMADPDLLFWNEIQRDELDNTIELIELLASGGGLDLLAHASNAKDEDVFTYGPNLVEQLRKKLALMRDHGFDGQLYLIPPGKEK